MRHTRVRSLGHVEAAVVAREDDDRPIAQTRGIDVLKQPADRVVERLNRGGIAGLEGVTVGVDDLRLRRVRNVRIVVGKIEEERPFAVRVDEALRLPRQVVLPFSAFGVARLRRGLTGVIDVEPLLARSVAGFAQVPFPNRRRRVPRGPQPFGDRRLFERQLLTDRRMQQLLRRGVGAARQERRQMQARGGPSGHDRRARRRADRRGHVRGSEPQPLGGQAIQVRRVVIAPAVDAEIVHAEIVSQNEDDVGRHTLCRCARIEAPQRAADQHGGQNERRVP